MRPPLPVDGNIAARKLAAIDPVLAGVIDRVGPCPLVPAPEVDLFQALLRSIIYQQLHGKAAAAIHTRVLALMPFANADALQSLPDVSLRAAGLSANKLLAVRDLSARTLDATIPSAGALAELSDDELIERLTKVRGIGPWTVHMLMIFYLGRPDVMPAGDFGIRKAFSLLYCRGRSVKPEAILRHSKRWQPHRSAASWYLWRSLDPVLPWGSDRPPAQTQEVP
jgi:3-methyladenine DNA glycosylase/8-oxoguanine DNA glycosylase